MSSHETKEAPMNVNIVEIVTAGQTVRHEFDSLRDARAYVTSWRRTNRGISAEITINGRAA
jgi:hypothetical protein